MGETRPRAMTGGVPVGIERYHAGLGVHLQSFWLWALPAIDHPVELPSLSVLGVNES